MKLSSAARKVLQFLVNQGGLGIAFEESLCSPSLGRRLAAEGLVVRTPGPRRQVANKLATLRLTDRGRAEVAQ